MPTIFLKLLVTISLTVTFVSYHQVEAQLNLPHHQSPRPHHSQPIVKTPVVRRTSLVVPGSAFASAASTITPVDKQLYHSHNNVYVIYQVYNNAPGSVDAHGSVGSSATATDSTASNGDLTSAASNRAQFPEKDILHALSLVQNYLAANSTTSTRAVIAAASRHDQPEVVDQNRIPPLFRPVRLH